MHLHAQRRFFAAAFSQLVARVAHHLVLVLAVVAQLGRENQLVEERAHARHSRLQLVGRRGRLAETGLQAAADTGRDLLDLVGIQFGRRALELCDALVELAVVALGAENEEVAVAARAAAGRHRQVFQQQLLLAFGAYRALVRFGNRACHVVTHLGGSQD